MLLHYKIKLGMVGYRPEISELRSKLAGGFRVEDSLGY